MEAMSEKKKKKMDSISCDGSAQYGPVSIRLRFVKEYDEELGIRQWRLRSSNHLPQIIEPPTPPVSDADRRTGKESDGDSCLVPQEPKFFRLFGVDIPVYQHQETREEGKASRKRNPNYKSDDSVPKKPRRLKFVLSKHPY